MGARGEWWAPEASVGAEASGGCPRRMVGSGDKWWGKAIGGWWTQMVGAGGKWYAPKPNGGGARGKRRASVASGGHWRRVVGVGGREAGVGGEWGVSEAVVLAMVDAGASGVRRS